MAWKRNEILSRLAEVLGGISGVEFERNRLLTTDKRPAILLLDSDEVAERAAFNRGRPSNAPNLVVMTPEIYVYLKNVKPINETVGEQLNDLGAKVIKAILNDAQLNELVGGNGEIRYEGFTTDLGEDRTIEGKARVVVSFVYVIRPNEL